MGQGFSIHFFYLPTALDDRKPVSRYLTHMAHSEPLLRNER